MPQCHSCFQYQSPIQRVPENLTWGANCRVQGSRTAGLQELLGVQQVPALGDHSWSLLCCAPLSISVSQHYQHCWSAGLFQTAVLRKSWTVAGDAFCPWSSRKIQFPLSLPGPLGAAGLCALQLPWGSHQPLGQVSHGNVRKAMPVKRWETNHQVCLCFWEIAL